MRVESSNNSNKEGNNAKFPVGMEVLVVDDEPVCLTKLVKQLTICKYKVTATNQAIKALQMLRENRDRFDLVISDVHMPDMDGFKLLELIGLEMDLPVIMLSANGETDTVMKGISHGACDYLLKPVRIEDLKVIWKHVVMKKSKNNASSCIITRGDGPTGEDNSNNNNNNMRAKRRIEEDEDEEERDSDETGERKKIKARVVWSVELHRKFVEAVNDLGIDKAVPKKILEKMNVEQLTRENVASHLQKYRLYLKRLRNVTCQPVQSDFGSRNSQYIHLSSLESFKNYHISGRYRQYVPATPSPVIPYQSSPANFGTNQLTTATSALTLPALVPLTGTGTCNLSTNNNNGILVNNNGNNQNNLFMGVAGTTTSTYSFAYMTQTDNGINYSPLPALPVDQITNLPSIGAGISPLVTGANNASLTGENSVGGTGDELQQVVASFNNLKNANNNNNNNNNSSVNQSLSALFKPIKNMNNNSSVSLVGTDGEMSFGAGTSTAVDQLSSSDNGGDNSGLNNVDELLSAILKPTDDSLLFVDDMFAN